MKYEVHKIILFWHLDFITWLLQYTTPTQPHRKRKETSTTIIGMSHCVSVCVLEDDGCQLFGYLCDVCQVENCWLIRRCDPETSLWTTSPAGNISLMRPIPWPAYIAMLSISPVVLMFGTVPANLRISFPCNKGQTKSIQKNKFLEKSRPLVFTYLVQIVSYL